MDTSHNAADVKEIIERYNKKSVPKDGSKDCQSFNDYLKSSEADEYAAIDTLIQQIKDADHDYVSCQRLMSIP